MVQNFLWNSKIIWKFKIKRYKKSVILNLKFGKNGVWLSGRMLRIRCVTDVDGTLLPDEVLWRSADVLPLPASVPKGADGLLLWKEAAKDSVSDASARRWQWRALQRLWRQPGQVASTTAQTSFSAAHTSSKKLWHLLLFPLQTSQNEICHTVLQIRRRPHRKFILQLPLLSKFSLRRKS